MPEYHLRSVEKVLELPLAKEALDAATSLRGQALESPTYNKVEKLIIGRIAPVKNAILSSAENNIPKEVKTKAMNGVSHLDNLVSGGIERVTTKVPVLAKPSSEIVCVAKKACSCLANYLATFWIARAALRLADSTLCLIQIMAQIIGTSFAEPLGDVRRIIHSILDQHVDSAQPGVDAAAAHDAKLSPETDDTVSASEPQRNVDEDEDVITEIMEAEDAASANTEASNSNKNEVTEIKDFKDSPANPNVPEPEKVIDEDFQEEVLRKASLLAVKEIEPIQLKTYEKRMEGIEEEEDGFNSSIHSIDEDTSTQTEETVEDAIIKTDGYQTEIHMDGKESFVEDILTLPSLALPSLGDSPDYVPVLPEATFIAPPAPSSASSPRRYPGYRHLYSCQPYQERYDMVGPIENLLDELIGIVPQLSSSGTTSRVPFFEKPEDIALPDDSFDSSF